MGTLRKLFTGVKDYFKGKPKPNIKMINEVNEVPRIDAANPISKRWRKRNRVKGVISTSFGISPFKFSRRCSKDWLP